MCALLSRGYKKEFYTMLEEDMFDDMVSVKILRALKSGFKFSQHRLDKFREITDIKLADLTGILDDVNKFDGWLLREDVLDFIGAYRKKVAKDYLEKGNLEKAIEYSKPVEFFVRNTVMEDYRNHLLEVREGADKGLVGLTTGLKSLDVVSGGLIPSKTWIVGGYNAYGKTFFMTNIVNNIIDLDKRVCVVTLEMTKEDILDRLIGQRLGLGVFTLAKTENKEKVEEMIKHFDSNLDDMNLHIIDHTNDIDDIVTAIRVANSNRHIDVLCLDFIQLVSARGKGNIYEKISYVSQELQKLTKEIGCSSVLLSQVNNASQSGHAGDVYGFKGAGEIGQIADVAIKLQRFKDDHGEFTSAYILDVVKNRSGRTGEITCKISFPSGEITEYISLEEESDE